MTSTKYTLSIVKNLRIIKHNKINNFVFPSKVFQCFRIYGDGIEKKNYIFIENQMSNVLNL